MVSDDDLELNRYVCEFFQQFMTEFERRVLFAIMGRQKAALCASPGASEMLLRRWGQLGDRDIDAALADGPEAFRRRVRDRLLSEHTAEIFVNRCPKCGRIVRTPQALQCFWCGFDWH